jgi:hypothetical protein
MEGAARRPAFFKGGRPSRYTGQVFSLSAFIGDGTQKAARVFMGRARKNIAGIAFFKDHTLVHDKKPVT